MLNKASPETRAAEFRQQGGMSASFNVWTSLRDVRLRDEPSLAGCRFLQFFGHHLDIRSW
jgi:hypothetical protein